MNLAAFGVRKPVPVNLLMFAILVAGVIYGLGLRREFFPEADPDQALVSMAYPGATPAEVEDGLAIKVEDKLVELDEVKEVRTTLAEGGGGISVEFREGVDVDNAMDEVDRAINSLTDLPAEAEEIQSQLFEPRLPIIRVNIFGELDEQVMKRAIRDVRDDLRSLPGMGEVLIAGVRNYEVRVDVNRQAMLKHGVSLPDVSQAIRLWMTEVPGGTVRSKAGNVKVRTIGVQERAAEIEHIIVKTGPLGAVIHVGDIAKVAESFIDEQVINRFNGKPSSSLTVFKVGDQDIVGIAGLVKAYVAGRNGKPFEPELFERMMLMMQRAQAQRESKRESETAANESGHRDAEDAAEPGTKALPDAKQAKLQQREKMPIERLRAWELGARSNKPLPVGAKLQTNSDLARFVEGRLDLLVRNAAAGGILVFLTLLVFLHVRAAFWVAVGLLTAVMGTLVLMAAVGVTLNLLTMFGLIVVLGLLVDDAIVIAENIQSHHDRGEPALNAAINGAREVQWPVVATVLTSIVAFLPLSFIEGRIGTLLGALPAVVACSLTMSLVESILILPSHMAHGLKDPKDQKKKMGVFAKMSAIAKKVDAKRQGAIAKLVAVYGVLLKKVLRYRYVSASVAIAILLGTIGLVQPWPDGRVKYDFLPSSDAESIIVDLRLPIGSPIEETKAVVQKLETIARDQAEVKSIESIIGRRTNVDTGAAEAFSPHVAQMYIELKFVEERDRESSQVVSSIREQMQDQLDNVDRINYTEMSGGPVGAGITIQIRGDSGEKIGLAIVEIKELLNSFTDVRDVFDDNDLGQMELRIKLRPGAAAIGFTPLSVAQQVRGQLYGIDAHVFAADQEDIDVRVRIDEVSRRSLYSVENAWLISLAGKPVPLSEIADVIDSSTYATIKRIDRKRAVTITANSIEGVSAEQVVARLDLDAIRAKHPDLLIELAGRQKREAEAFGSLPKGFLAAAVMIYIILAWLFSNYFQPFMVMSVIPFSIVGAIWGHWLLGYEITFLSMIGFVALAGIVVNDSLILMRFFNDRRASGLSVPDALYQAGIGRVRAILLTTITTVLGLLPLILEQSFQAKFLIPMAITIAGGLVFGTAIVLLILPCVLLITDDVKGVLYYLWNGKRRSQTDTVASTA